MTSRSSSFVVVLAFVIVQLTTIAPLIAQEKANGREKPGGRESASIANFPRKIHLRSGYFATPMSIPDDTHRRTITSLELKSDQLTEEGGKARMSFDESEIAFNEFGDASVVRMLRNVSHDVVLQAVQAQDTTSEGRRLYVLVFPKSLWKNRIYLAWSPGLITKTRLLIHGSILSLLHILPLEDRSRAAAAIADEPMRDKISLRTHHFQNEPSNKASDNSQGYISIRGTIGGEGYLMHDLNRTSFSAFGDGGMSTLLAFLPLPVTIKERHGEDPLSRGRRVFDLVPVKRRPMPPGSDGAKPQERPQYSLVISPTTAGSHRLIIRQDDKVRHVLPLYDPLRRRYLHKRHELENTSNREQHGVAEIRKLIGSNFDFKVQDDKISSISFEGENGSDATLSHLNDLPHLKRLHLSGCRDISPAGFAPLKNLPELESLSFSCTPISDPGLEHIANLHNLRFLQIYDETWYGITSADVPHITDDGLVSLANLENLESLHLYVFCFNGFGTKAGSG